MYQPQTGKSPSKKTLIWAIPVALVVLVLFIALVVMVAKYRSLQRSFMSFANRGYARADEEDDEVAVTFHQGILSKYFTFNHVWDFTIQVSQR